MCHIHSWSYFRRTMHEKQIKSAKSLTQSGSWMREIANILTNRFHCWPRAKGSSLNNHNNYLTLSASQTLNYTHTKCIRQIYFFNVFVDISQNRFTISLFCNSNNLSNSVRHIQPFKLILTIIFIILLAIL